jgi:hypothetical protein
MRFGKLANCAYHAAPADQSNCYAAPVARLAGLFPPDRARRVFPPAGDAAGGHKKSLDY